MACGRIGGIYAIVCSGSWRSYIGSSVDLTERKSEHFRILRKGTHDNKELQVDFNKFGESSFYWEILETVEDSKKLLEKEDYWIRCGCNLYNKVIYSDIRISQKRAKRFWDFVKIKSDKECWNWIGAKDKDGYGRFSVCTNGIKKAYRSNRLAYFLYKNHNWDKNSVVCHSCDNPSCCNPNHLFLGSLSDNSKDRTKKNRGNNKLNYTIAEDIREQYRLGLKSSRKIRIWLQDKHNLDVSYNCINVILRNKTFHNPEYNVNSRKDYRISNLKQFFKG